MRQYKFGYHTGTNPYINENTDSSNKLDDELYRLTEKNDDPDFWYNHIENSTTQRYLKKGKNESSSSNENTQSSSSNMISKIIGPAVVVAICAGIVPGFEWMNVTNPHDNSSQDTSQNTAILSGETILPFEIVDARIVIDAYRDIASFEATIDMRNWSDDSSFNEEEFVLRLSGQNSIDFELSTDYNLVIKNGVDLIYELSQTKTSLGNTRLIIKGDISNLSKNANYSLSLLRHNERVAGNSFITTSALGK